MYDTISTKMVCRVFGIGDISRNSKDVIVENTDQFLYATERLLEIANNIQDKINTAAGKQTALYQDRMEKDLVKVEKAISDLNDWYSQYLDARS